MPLHNCFSAPDSPFCRFRTSRSLRLATTGAITIPIIYLESKGELKPGSFFPQPDVFSSIIMLTPGKRINFQIERDLFFKLVRAGFSSRRKTLKNNIKHSHTLSAAQKQRILDSLQNEYNIDTLRTEELSVESFIVLARSMVK